MNDERTPGPRELSAEALARRCDPERFRFETTADLEDTGDFVGQDRAIRAVRFAVGMGADGFNVYALGSEEIDRRSLLRHFLEERARDEPPPPDVCYVYNFDEPYAPRVLRLPAGTGAAAAKALDEVLQELTSALEELQRILRQMPHHQRRVREEVGALDREIARLTVDDLFGPLHQRFSGHAALTDHLDRVENDIVHNVRRVVGGAQAQEEQQQQLSAALGGGARTSALERPELRPYRIHVIVDHSGSEHAPVIYQDMPTFQNLVVLVGSPLLYYLLSHHDPDFGDLFKVEADFDERSGSSRACPWGNGTPRGATRRVA